MTAFYVTRYYVSPVGDEYPSGPFVHGKYGRLSSDWKKAVQSEVNEHERRFLEEHGHRPDRNGQSFAVWQFDERPKSPAEAAKLAKGRRPDAVYLIQWGGWNFVRIHSDHVNRASGIFGDED